MQKFTYTPSDSVMRNINLQLFGGSDSTAANGTVSATVNSAVSASSVNTAESTTAQVNEGTGADQPATQAEKTFTQAELDRIIDQRLARFKRDEDKRLAQAREEGKSEAEKLAKMSETERVEHAKKVAEDAAKAREDAIARREAELTMRELRAEAVDTLAQKGLPTQLADILNYKSAEDCNASIAKVEETFRAAVQEGVNARLKQSGVSLKNGATPEPANMTDAEYYSWKFGKK